MPITTTIKDRIAEIVFDVPPPVDVCPCPAVRQPTEKPFE